MTEWTKDELDAIGAAEELRIMSLRQDGTLRKPVTIWVVRVDDALYVRSVNGRASGWFRGTQVRQEGRIRADGVERRVNFVDEADPQRNLEIDKAYRQKYSHYSNTIVSSTLTPQARAATLRLVPSNPS